MLKMNKNTFMEKKPNIQASKAARRSSMETVPQEIPYPWITRN